MATGRWVHLALLYTDRCSSDVSGLPCSCKSARLRALQALLVLEKSHTRALDDLTADVNQSLSRKVHDDTIHAQKQADAVRGARLPLRVRGRSRLIGVQALHGAAELAPVFFPQLADFRSFYLSRLLARPTADLDWFGSLAAVPRCAGEPRC
jgi:hypothetical protein